MKYLVDPALCSGHGQCFHLAPQVYSGDDDGYVGVQGSYVEVPQELEVAARTGAQACPESAIRLEGSA